MRLFLFLLLFSATGLLQKSQAQVTTVKSPAMNQPKLNIPASLPAKLLLVDSLKKARLSAGKILISLIPRYYPQEQREMIQNLVVMYKSGFKTPELAVAVKGQYPDISFQVVTKLFYAALYEYKGGINQTQSSWPVFATDSLTDAYGIRDTTFVNNKPTFYIKLLKDGGDSLSTVFSYISIYLRTGSLANYTNIENNTEGLARAGYPIQDIFKSLTRLKGKDAQTLMYFCMGLKRANADPVSTARALKSGSLINEEISQRMKAGGFTAAEILSALQQL